MLADLSLLVLAAPEDEDVVAGPIGFVIFVALVIAVALLGWSLNKHLKKAHRAAGEGVYGDPVGPADPIEPTEPIERTEPGKAGGEK
jgi:hypothetical protein